MILTTPLNRLVYISCGGDLAVGGVGVGSADVAGGTEDLAHVLGEVDAIGVPSAVLLDGKWTSGGGLGGSPIRRQTGQKATLQGRKEPRQTKGSSGWAS